MFARALVIAVMSLMGSVSAYAAEAPKDAWKITAIEGEASAFRNGGWSKLKLGDAVAANVLTRTSAKGAMTLVRGKASITLDPDTEIQIENRPTNHQAVVRLHSGTLAVETQPDPTRPLAVQTAFAVVDIKDTIAGIQTDSARTAVSVQRGGVDVTDVAHRKHGEVTEGKSAKINSARGIVIAAGALNESAGAAAAKIAGTLTSVADPDTVDSSIKEMHAPTRSGPEAVAVATPLVIASHEVAVKAPASEAAVEAPKTEDADNSAPRWEEHSSHSTDFMTLSWSEGRDGRIVMTPLFKIMFGLNGVDAMLFWPVVAFCFFFLGLLLHFTLQDVAFGGFNNTFLAMAAAVVAVCVRDGLLVDVRYLHYEPILTIGIALVTLVTAMAGLRLAASRMA